MLGQTVNCVASRLATPGSAPVHAHQPHNAQVTFQFLACILQNIESSFSELFDWLQEKQNMGQGRSGMGMETRVRDEWEERLLLFSLC